LSRPDPYLPEGRATRSGLYLFLQYASLGPLIKLYFRHRTRGLSHVPDRKGAIIATNHASVLDPPLVACDIPRPLFTMAKQALHDIPLFGRAIRACYSFPVRRGTLDHRALRRAVRLLRNDNLMLLFPEGTRTRDGELQKGRPGIGKIATEADCPIVPGYLHGTFRAMPPGSVFPRPTRTTLYFGKPLTFDADGGDDDAKSRRRRYNLIAENVMQAIARLKKRAVESSTGGHAQHG